MTCRIALAATVLALLAGCANPRPDPATSARGPDADRRHVRRRPRRHRPRHPPWRHRQSHHPRRERLPHHRAMARRPGQTGRPDPAAIHQPDPLRRLRNGRRRPDPVRRARPPVPTVRDLRRSGHRPSRRRTRAEPRRRRRTEGNTMTEPERWTPEAEKAVYDAIGMGPESLELAPDRRDLTRSVLAALADLGLFAAAEARGHAKAVETVLALHSPRPGWERDWKDPAEALRKAWCAGCELPGVSVREIGKCPTRKALADYLEAEGATTS